MSDSDDEQQQQQQQQPPTSHGLKHPKKVWNLHRKTWTTEDLRNYIDQYLQHIAIDQPQCKNVLRGGRVLLQCSCLATNLSNPVIRERVTQYLITFLHQTTRQEQTRILTQRIQQSKRLEQNTQHNNNNNHSQDTGHVSPHVSTSTTTTTTTNNISITNNDKEHCRFALPGDEHVMICSSALLTLLGFSRHVWAHCLKCADDCKRLEDKIMPQHGARRSNSGNALNETIALALETFFQRQLKDSMSTSSTTSTTFQQHSCPNTPIILRSTTTKKGLYELFCQERGWELVKSVEGNIKPVPLLNGKEKQRQEQPLQEQQPICSLSSFLAYWKKNYPQLDVPWSRRGELTSPEIARYESPKKTSRSASPMRIKEEDSNTFTPVSMSMATPPPTTTTPRRSFAETTNLMTYPRCNLWTMNATTATTTIATHEQDIRKKTPHHDKSYEQFMMSDPSVLHSHNQWMQRELQQCRERLHMEQEEIQRLKTCLLQKESHVERLEAENKHLHAAIALFRVNVSTTKTKTTESSTIPTTTTTTTISMRSKPLKRKLVSTNATPEQEMYDESRDENKEGEEGNEERETIAMTMSSLPKRLRV